MPKKKRLPQLPDIPNKRYFPIREASELVGVKDYVLRYWEKQFSQLHPTKKGSHRCYLKKDIEIAREIRRLLYGEGYSIVGAKNYLSAKDLPQQQSDVEDSQDQQVNFFNLSSKEVIRELETIVKELRDIQSFLRN